LHLNINLHLQNFVFLRHKYYKNLQTTNTVDEETVISSLLTQYVLVNSSLI
jgi:hypothetical protein